MAFGDDMIDGYADGEEPVVFHYKRGSFRAHEDERYRDLATGKNQPKKGLFRVLVGTKGNRTMFFVMVACFVLVLFVGLLTGGENAGGIAGAQCTLTAFSFDETVYVSLQVQPARRRGLPERETGPLELEAAFQTIAADGTVTGTELLAVTYTGAEAVYHCRFTDFDVAAVTCTVSAAGEKPLELRSAVEVR